MATGLAVAGLGVARLRARPRPFRVLFGVVTVVAAGVIVAGLVLSHGRGAGSAFVIGGVGWLLISLVWYRSARLRDRMVRRRVLWLGIGWMLVAVLAGGVVVYGVSRGGLPGPSLMFRWYYWTGAIRMMAHHPWFGVGAGNFDRHYVQYKPVEAPEEVKDPHNLLMTPAAEWGIVGLTATIVFMVSVSAAMCFPPGSVCGSGALCDERPRNGALVFLWLIPLFVTVLAARTLAVPSEIWLPWAFTPALIWAMAALALCVDSDHVVRFEDDPLQLTGGLVAAMVGVLIDNTISFSMVYPGSACTFFALAGLAMAVRRIESSSPVRGRGGAGSPAGIAPTSAKGSRAVVVTAAVSVIVAVLYWPVVVVPVRRATCWLTFARNADTGAEAFDGYHRAVQADPLDPVAASELAGWALQRERQTMPDGRTGADVAVESALTAVRRDPDDNRSYRTLSNAYAARHGVREDPNDADRAAEASAKAVARYPELPTLRFEYGEMLALQATARRDPERLRQALDQMQCALRLDDRRPPGEIRRFKPEHRARLEARIRALDALPLTTTRP